MAIENKKEFVAEVKEFMQALSGQINISHEDRIKMFRFYSIYYNDTQTNYDCDLCMIRIHSKLTKLIGE